MFSEVCLGCLCLFGSLFGMSVWVVSVCLGCLCLFGSVFRMSVWVVCLGFPNVWLVVCLEVFSECLFGLSVWEFFLNVCLGFPNFCLVVCLEVFLECLFGLSVWKFFLNFCLGLGFLFRFSKCLLTVCSDEFWPSIFLTWKRQMFLILQVK